MRVARGAFVLICAVGLSPGAGACLLSIGSDVQIAPDRLAGIVIDIPHAVTESVGGIPAGWRIVIDNELTWRTIVTAHAILGVAFVGDLSFVKTMKFRPQLGYSCASLDRARTARVTVTRYRDDKLLDETLRVEHVRIGEH